ncbi:hypothetical protein P152DRAFT_381587, partial [Eremomyces bilateralis CBS 781.70]
SAESAGQQSAKRLLFGEIDTSSCSTLSTGRRSRTNSSVCALVDSRDRFFNRFWAEENCRDSFLSQVDRKTLPNLRLVCHDFGARAAPILFEEVSITFKTSTFARPTRLLALERIGHHVKTFKFNMPHLQETFLPPLIDDVTGEGRSFVYTPQIHKPETLIGKVKLPKYGSWEMTDMLIKQYPPLFHAATNIPSFIRALEALPTLSHLIVNCPGQTVGQRNRRSTVDYALISLRIAVERASLPLLSRLTFAHIHPGGLLYMHPMLGLGSPPGTAKCWRQIKHLSLTVDAISVEPTPANMRGDGLEHLRVLHTFFSAFSPRVKQLYFQWLGGKGPCPLSLDLEPALQSQPSVDGPSPKPSVPSTANTTPLSPSPSLPAVYFPRLTHLSLQSLSTPASHLAALITRHQRSLEDFAFEACHLTSGDWDEALEPLTAITGSSRWKGREVEVWDVPLII